MLDDAGPVCVLTTGGRRRRPRPRRRRRPDGRGPRRPGRRRRAGAARRRRRSPPPSGPPSPPTAPTGCDHPAYVIYTSGSTGRAQGRRHAVPRADQHAAQPPPAHLRPGGAGGRAAAADRAHGVVLLRHVVGGAALAGRGPRGPRLRRAAAPRRRRPRRLLRRPPHRRRQRHPDLRPGAVRGGPARRRPRRPARRHRPVLVLLGGEAVSDAVWDRLRDTEGVLGYNLYGPTEYTINTLGGGTDDSATPTVGWPIWNTRAYVLDASLRPVPAGMPGELYIAGVGLARGYLRRPGPDRRAVRRRPVRRARRPDVPHRRPRAAAARRQPRLPGPHRRPGEDPRLPGRAGRGGHRGRWPTPTWPRPRWSPTPPAVPGSKRLVAYLVPAAGPSSPTAEAGAAAARPPPPRSTSGGRSTTPSTARSAPPSAPRTSRAGTAATTARRSRSTRCASGAQATVDRILALRPRRVLEIGVGSGLLLGPIAPQVEAYWGTDLAPSVIDQLRADVAADPALAAKVELRCQPAHVTDGLPAGEFDVVVLNSVMQYFPDADHLAEVVAGARRPPGAGRRAVRRRRAGPALAARLPDRHRAAEGRGRRRHGRRSTRRRSAARSTAPSTLEKELLVDPAFWPPWRGPCRRRGLVSRAAQAGPRPQRAHPPPLRRRPPHDAPAVHRDFAREIGRWSDRSRGGPRGCPRVGVGRRGARPAARRSGPRPCGCAVSPTPARRARWRRPGWSSGATWPRRWPPSTPATASSPRTWSRRPAPRATPPPSSPVRSSAPTTRS